MRSCTECVDKLYAREDSGLGLELGLGLGLIVSHNLKLTPFLWVDWVDCDVGSSSITYNGL